MVRTGPFSCITTYKSGESGGADGVADAACAGGTVSAALAVFSAGDGEHPVITAAAPPTAVRVRKTPAVHALRNLVCNQWASVGERILLRGLTGSCCRPSRADRFFSFVPGHGPPAPSHRDSIARGPVPSTARPTFLVVEMVARLSMCRRHHSLAGRTAGEARCIPNATAIGPANPAGFRPRPSAPSGYPEPLRNVGHARCGRTPAGRRRSFPLRPPAT